MKVEISSSYLPTKFGGFNIYIFKENNLEHVALVKGNVNLKEEVLTRVHSECLTGDILRSLKCDCGEQLNKSLEGISKKEEGLLLYLRQEGRGIGLFNKIKAYNLQHKKNLDTIQSNLELGFEAEMREYSIVKEVLEYLNIKSINLLTNNPDKVKKIKKFGVKIIKRIPLIIKSNNYNKDYLKIKREKMNHLF